jgi:hypothetical protein
MAARRRARRACSLDARRDPAPIETIDVALVVQLPEGLFACVVARTRHGGSGHVVLLSFSFNLLLGVGQARELTGVACVW